jgi:hypothetical protein
MQVKGEVTKEMSEGRGETQIISAGVSFQLSVISPQ